MTLVRVEAPEELAVSEGAAWAHLRLPISEEMETPDDAELVRLLVDSAIGQIDGADGLLSRALITQTWELRIDWNFPRCIEIPLPPCQEIESITYVDVNGATQTLSPASYHVIGILASAKAEVIPAFDAWPTTRAIPEAVTVRFRAGYGDAPEDVPAPIRNALLEIVASRYAVREGVITGTIVSKVPQSALDALESYRVRSFG